MTNTSNATTAWQAKVPAFVDLQSFHDLAHGIAGRITPPDGLSAHDVGQLIKTKILRELPPEYVEHQPAKGIEVFYCDGTFSFPKPISREIMLEAVEAAGLIVSDNHGGTDDSDN